MTGWLFAFSGVAAGAIQAGLLGRSVRRGPWPMGLVARLGLVAVVLAVAARSGHVVAGAAGWFAGFLVMAAIAHRGLR